MKVLLALVVVMSMVVPAFAGHDDPPSQLNGEAAVTSAVGGFVQSGNITRFVGGSYATQRSMNTSIAGFDTYKQGNEVGAMTYGSSTGSSFGLVLGSGLAGGFQAGTYSASSQMSIPQQHGNH